MKYTAINIGPIVDTLSMARKPRELWAGSFLFSYLMETLIETLKRDYEIISPAKESPEQKVGVGVFPDRVFIKGEVSGEHIRQALEAFKQRVGLDDVDNYLNVMTLTIAQEKEHDVIRRLNDYLNNMELSGAATDERAKNGVLHLMQKKGGSPLFEKAFGKRDFAVRSLPEIASAELQCKNKQTWGEIVEKMKAKDEEEDDSFCRDLKKAFGKDYKSYHKYVCIVQADGDSMGSVVSNIRLDEVGKLSGELMKFGVEASRLVKKYGGMPIYAGGDDLLFIAPVVSELDGVKTDIFRLLDEIDKKYAAVKEKVEDYGLTVDGKKVSTAMSYGVSISYYKYPLYEALESARTLLFGVAKKVKGKNAIAWKIQKHSGSSFSGAYTKNDAALHDAFSELRNSLAADSKLVSSLAHKLRAQKSVVDLFWGEKEEQRKIRLKAFMEKNMDWEDKDGHQKNYIEVACRLLLSLIAYWERIGLPEDNHDGKTAEERREDLLSSGIYNMLRTAKFTNGEEDDYE